MKIQRRHGNQTGAIRFIFQPTSQKRLQRRKKTLEANGQGKQREDQKVFQIHPRLGEPLQKNNFQSGNGAFPGNSGRVQTKGAMFPQVVHGQQLDSNSGKIELYFFVFENEELLEGFGRINPKK